MNKAQTLLLVAESPRSGENPMVKQASPNTACLSSVQSHQVFSTKTLKKMPMVRHQSHLISYMQSALVLAVGFLTEPEHH